MRVPRVFGTKPTIVTTHKPGIRVLLKSLEIRFEGDFRGAGDHLHPRKQDMFPEDAKNPTIADSTDPSCCLGADSGPKDSANNLSRVIRRAIIHNDYLEVRIALRQHALNSFTKKMGLLVENEGMMILTSSTSSC